MASDYHPDPEINAEVAQEALESERWWLCPDWASVSAARGVCRERVSPTRRRTVRPRFSVADVRILLAAIHVYREQSPRITFDAEPIAGVIQTDKCYGCAMGLCHPREYHPQRACDVFTATHDSREVWRALWRAIKNADADVAGAGRLHEMLYAAPRLENPVEGETA